MKELISKIEKLESQNWEINLEIMKELDFADEKAVVDGTRFTIPGSRHSHEIINYTGSIDDAIRLIPNGWGMVGLEKLETWCCELALDGNPLVEQRIADAHNIASIAITLTSLKLKHDLEKE
jgi:hypothetical protein